MDIKRTKWGIMPDSREAGLFTLTNARGMTATISDFGATLVGLTAPDRHGRMADVVLGYDTLDGYLADPNYMGRTVGRVANRIGGASFELDGKTYGLPANLGANHHHGGPGGFHTRLFTADVIDSPQYQKLRLSYRSIDGEEGYPGTIDVSVVYTMTGEGLRICCRAETDKPTVVNLANHAYFNLSGVLGEGIGNHVLTLNATSYLVTDDELVPTGEIADVAGTPLDFTRPKAMGLDIDAAHEAISQGQGFDHCFVVDGDPGELTNVAQVFHGGSGRVLDVCSTQPCVHFYSGNHLPARMKGKLGALYGRRHGFCLEAQGYVDAPNRPEFPAVTLRPGEKYKQVTEYRLSSM